MKVNGTGGYFYGYSAPGFGRNQAGASSPLTGRANSDQVTLSKQVLAMVQMQNRLRALAQAGEDAKNSPEAQALDSMRKAMKIQKTCNKIAARVRAGDHVPQKDLRYLMKHDPLAYQMAMASRKPNEDPKKWDSAIPKEKQENGQQAASAGEQPGGMQASSDSGSSSGASCDGGASGGTGTGSSSGA